MARKIGEKGDNYIKGVNGEQFKELQWIPPNATNNTRQPTYRAALRSDAQSIAVHRENG